MFISEVLVGDEGNANLLAVCNVLDERRTGSVVPGELQKGLQCLGVDLSDDDIALLVDAYGSPGGIDIAGFTEAVAGRQWA